MRVTYRHQTIREYWEDRWQAVPLDDGVVNPDAYPAKYAERVVHAGGCILEAGCGAGRLLRYYAAKGFNIVGIDFVDHVIDKLKEADPALKVEKGDICALRFANHTFRTVLAFGLYHNLEEGLDRAIAETYRVLEPGGRVCASFRADNIQTRINDWLAERKRARHASGATASQFHKLNLTRGEFAGRFQKAGFDVESVFPVENMPLLYKFKPFRAAGHKQFNESLGRREGYRLSAAGSLIQRTLTGLFAEQFCNVYVLIARRRDGA
jgi:SAM-dependent methyltransferase